MAEPKDAKDMKDEIITFKVSGEEAAMIRRGAAAERQSVSQYIRSCILRDRFLEGDPEAKKVFKENVKKAMDDFVTRVIGVQPKARKARS